jgi:integrase
MSDPSDKPDLRAENWLICPNCFRGALEYDDAARQTGKCTACGIRFRKSDDGGVVHLRWYWLAIETGLRRNELGSLTRSSFDLTAGTIRLSGRNAKDGMNAVIELGPETCEDLRSWLESKPFGQRLFPFGHKTAKLFRSDLKRAGILARDEHDQQLDFHALRHTTATRLALSGVPIRAAMGHLRHKTIAMTAEVYGRLQRGDVRAAVRSVPRLPLHSSTQSAKTTVEAR